MMQNLPKNVARRYRQLTKIWREDGADKVFERLRRAAAARIAPPTLSLPVHWSDVLAADLTITKQWGALAPFRRESMTVNWVTTPPGFLSGGHTTMFRLIEHLHRCGHECRLYLYDVYGNDAAYLRSMVREFFPKFDGPVHDVSAGMHDAHAVVATAWQTAYPVYNDTCAGKRFYLVQDFEPWFHPVGAQSALAENTYRMGFHGLTAGRFLADKLQRKFGMRADAFDFGCDTTTYRLLGETTARDGVVFYAKHDTPRRAFELGVLALQLLTQRHPNIVIHFYGSDLDYKLPFPYLNHGAVNPKHLNEIYNRCRAGLSLSMTNVSLVPHEMLSAGCVPVVNDSQHNRIVLDNPFVRYASATPHALAAALSEIVEMRNFDLHSTSCANSVAAMSWLRAGQVVEEAIGAAVDCARA